MIAKKHKTKDGRLILSLCDSDLIGKVFEDENFQLDLASDFYQGEELDESKICTLTKKVYIIIFAGEGAIKFGLKYDLILKENIRHICNVPYAQTIIE